MLNQDEQQKLIGALLKMPSNTYCADCRGKSPCWASIDFGVFICMNCSGAHRGLGPSITRVKSTKLDKWNRQWIEYMKVGNSVLNQYWQSSLSKNITSNMQQTMINIFSKPDINSSLNEIKKFVDDKYIKRKYVTSGLEYMSPLERYKKILQKKKPCDSLKQTKDQLNESLDRKNKNMDIWKDRTVPSKKQDANKFLMFKNVNENQKDLITFYEEIPSLIDHGQTINNQQINPKNTLPQNTKFSHQLFSKPQQQNFYNHSNFHSNFHTNIMDPNNYNNPHNRYHSHNNTHQNSQFFMTVNVNMYPNNNVNLKMNHQFNQSQQINNHLKQPAKKNQQINLQINQHQIKIQPQKSLAQQWK